MPVWIFKRQMRLSLPHSGCSLLEAKSTAKLLPQTNCPVPSGIPSLLYVMIVAIGAVGGSAVAQLLGMAVGSAPL